MQIYVTHSGTKINCTGDNISLYETVSLICAENHTVNHTTGLSYTPWNYYKTRAYLMFSGDIERDLGHEIFQTIYRWKNLRRTRAIFWGQIDKMVKIIPNWSTICAQKNYNNNKEKFLYRNTIYNLMLMSTKSSPCQN